MSILTSVLKLFLGDKSKKDINFVLPSVAKIHNIENNLRKISNDELRAKTSEFKLKIKDIVDKEEKEIEDLKNKVESIKDFGEKDAMFLQIDNKEKEVIKKIEKILDSLKEEAFAVLKETARRFTENEELEVTATEYDRYLSKNDFVEIRGEKAIWKNNWDANGMKVVWNMIHYDVQLIGGMVLHQGKIAEMSTGEGKTLVSTLPIYLNALSGKGVHVVTVNDYLAKRDASWNGPLFQFHGLSVDCIDKYEPHSDERKSAYNCDITYGTNNEFGFDYLRDNMSRDKGELVQRMHNFAIVDEVDSVLIDDARTPLIISGSVKQTTNEQLIELNPLVSSLFDKQKKYTAELLAEAKKKIQEGDEKEGGFLLLRSHRGFPKNKNLIKYLSEDGIKSILHKVENFHMQDNAKEMKKVDKELYFTIEEKTRSVELTDKGIEELTKGTSSDFFIMPDISLEVGGIEKMDISEEEKVQKKDEIYRNYSIKSERVHLVNQLLKAYTLFEKDVEYVVVENKVKIVDEQTGRIMEGRRYSDGLHQAIEAKENVKVQASSQTLATITLQNYFRMYNKLAGMTGTAVTEAGEFWEIYKLDVVSIPTNKPITRKDNDDFVYKTRKEKYNAVIEEIQRLVNQGRPVLVGTTSVEISEFLSKSLSLRKIKHNVLNAKLHKKEAEIIAEAGKSGVVTIATNMAGRGTDIKLSDEVKKAGGLAIVGTEKHDSRRVDRQLRGRAGRQGDPGSSQFYVSLEDDLMRVFGSERIIKVMNTIGLKEGEVIQHGMITKSIERAQKKVEENNFGVRKRLLEYDNVMNSQREIIYKKRRNALYGERLYFDIVNMIFECCQELVERTKKNLNFEEFKKEVISYFMIDPKIEKDFFEKSNNLDIVRDLFVKVYNNYKLENEIKVKTTYPLIKRLYETGSKYSNILIPFSDGIKNMNIVVNIENSYKNEGKSIISDFEKNVILALIDDKWKQHLKDMDNLKQYIQNVVYEQKDPLIVYKFEAFELFKKMIDDLNRETISFLLRARINQGAEDNIKNVTTTISQKNDYKEGRGAEEGKPKEKQEPIKRDMPKINRNDKIKIQNIKTGEILEMKYKQAIPMIEQGEVIIINE